MKCFKNCYCHLCRELSSGFVGDKTLSNSKTCGNNFILKEKSEERYKSVVKVQGPSSTLDVDFKKLR